MLGIRRQGKVRGAWCADRVSVAVAAIVIGIGVALSVRAWIGPAVLAVG